jgi:hypothetical protein
MRAIQGCIKLVGFIGQDGFRIPKTEAEKIRARELRSLYPQDSTAPGRATRALQVYVTTHQLHQQVLLTFDGDVFNPFGEFSALMDRRCKREGRQPWVAVAEVGDNNNFHFHLLGSNNMNVSALRRDWKLGMTDLKPLATVADIRHFSVYMIKDFELPADQRLDSRRYRAAPGYKPKFIDYGYATHDEAEILAQQKAGDRWAEVQEWKGNSAWCAGGYNWEK